MGLLSEIQNEAVSRDSDIGTLLRKCLVLAARMDSDVLEDWVCYELNGYPAEASLPKYRILSMTVRGCFSGPFGTSINNAPVESLVIKKITETDKFDMLSYRASITTIVDTAETRKASTMRVSLGDLALFLGSKVYDGYNAIDVWGEIPSMAVINIIESVKTRVLELALALEKKYPNIGEVGSMDSTTEKEGAQAIAHNIINGNVGFLGTANNSTITVNFSAGDLGALKSYLEQKGVSSTDMGELETALQADPKPESKGRFGPKVAAWLGKMAGKAASGAWKIGVGTGAAILQTAISQYYGLN